MQELAGSRSSQDAKGENAMATINRKTIEFYLNSMYVSETEYIALYNHFASATGAQKLTDIRDIYIEKNNQNALIEYIIKSNDQFYNGMVKA